MMSLNNILLAIVLMISSKCINGKNFTCYQCYYSAEHLTDEWNKPECMDSPATPGISVRARCREDFFCFVQEIYDIQTKQVVEFSRACSQVGFETKCTKDTYHVICRRTCQGDLCNRNVTSNFVDLYFNHSPRLFNMIQNSLYCLCATFVLYMLK